MDGHIRAVKEYFARRRINNFNQGDWLEACTEWVVNDLRSTGAQVTSASVGDGVLQQWLTSDIKDCCADGGCLLPLPATSPNRAVVNGPFCLQIDQIDDMSQPSYAALQEIRGTGSENLRVDVANEDQTQGGDSQMFTQLFSDYIPRESRTGNRPTNRNSRLMMLSLSDGVRNCQAMEMKFVPELSLDLPLGTKVLIKGPLDIRRGILLLLPGSVEVLGGGLDEIDQETVKNGVLEARLRDATQYLQRRQRPVDGIVYSHRNAGSGRVNRSTQSSTRPTQSSTRPTQPSNSAGHRPAPPFPASAVGRSSNVNAQPHRATSSFSDPSAILEDDEDFGAELIAAVDAAEQQLALTSAPSTSSASVNNPPAPGEDFFGGDDDDFLVAAVEEVERNFSGEITSTVSQVQQPTRDGSAPTRASSWRGSSTAHSLSTFRAPAPVQRTSSAPVPAARSTTISSVTAQSSNPFRAPAPVQRPPQTSSFKRPRPVGSPVVRVAEVAGANFDEVGASGLKVAGFVDGMKLEIAEHADKSPQCRPFLLTMPVALCDGRDSVKFLLGTSVLEKLTGVSAEEILQLLEMKGPRTKEVVNGLKRTLRDEVCGIFTVRRFLALVDSATNIVITDYERVDDAEMEAKWRERRQMQKRPRSGS